MELNSPTYTPLTHLGLLQVAGPDATTFLQGQLSNDIQTLTPGSHQLSALCDRKGRVLALLQVFRDEADYYLGLPSTLVPAITAHLQKFIMFSKATLTDASQTWAGLGVMGQAPGSVPAGAVLMALPGQQAWQLWLARTALPDYVAALSATHAQTDEAHYVYAQMQAGLPLIGDAQSGEFLPQPLNLIDLAAVSFKKGCFVGQEIIARMHYRGQVKKQLYFGIVDAAVNIACGDPVQADTKPVGTVVNALTWGDAHTAVLAIINNDALTHPLTVNAHPFTLGNLS